MYSWNPVLNKILELKHTYEAKHKTTSLIPRHEKTIVEEWANSLDNKEYLNLLEPVQITQKDNFVLLRYANCFAGTGEDRVRGDDFWNMHSGFYSECRSVVIDLKNECLALTPFRKFRNLGESEEYSLENIKKRIQNASSVEFSEKMDGSMISSRFYNNKIMLASSRCLDPENSWRLAEAYLMLTNSHQKMLEDHPSKTFVFEYISLKDAHLVRYTKEQEGLYLIGIRDVNTGEEASYKTILQVAEKYSVPTTTLHNTDLSTVMSSLGEKKSSEAEGFVLNIDGFKVKIKYDDYCKVHGVLGSISSVNVIIRSIADNTLDDLFSKVPSNHHARILMIADKVYDYVRTTQAAIKKYTLLLPQDDIKTVMLWIDSNVPKELRAYVRAEYLGTEYNIIKSRNGHYKTLDEMGIDIFATKHRDVFSGLLNENTEGEDPCQTNLRYI